MRHPVRAGVGAMSCLPSDTLSYFEQREQELLALNKDLEIKRAHALAEASSAVQGASAAASAALPPRAPVFDAVAAAHASPGGPDGDDGPRLRLESPSGVSAAAESLLLGATPSSAAGAGAAGGSEALHTTIRFQNARIVALQEDLDKAMKELASRSGDAQRLQQEGHKAQDELARLQKGAAAADKQREALKGQLAAAEAKVKELEREKTELVKDKGSFDLQQRRAEAESSAKEARMNRLVEENEKYKAALKDAGSQDRDRAVADRREVERLQAEVRKLERQRSELVNAFKKQMKLIEVLKRQRAHMEAARVLSFTEEEFIRVLELGDKLGE